VPCYPIISCLEGKMKKFMTIMLILQAIIALLLFFSEDYTKPITIGLFYLVDAVILGYLISRRWSYAEAFLTATFLCSLIFIVLFSYYMTTLILILGIEIMLLFLVSALLMHISAASLPKDNQRKRHDMQKPELFPLQTYNLDELEKELDINIAESEKYSRQDQNRKNIPSAMAYELEREAYELKRADNYIQKKRTEFSKDELAQEAMALENAQRQLNRSNMFLKNAELGRQAASLEKAEKTLGQLDALSLQQHITKEAKLLEDTEKSLSKSELLSQDQEIRRQAMALEDAELQIQKLNALAKTESIRKQAKKLEKTDRQIREVRSILHQKNVEKQAKNLQEAEEQLKELEFLGKQERIISQAKQLAKAQKDIDSLKGSKVKTEESMFAATETGNKYHKPDCVLLDKTPKNRLVLFTTVKDAQKKGYRPCKTCKP